VPLLKIKTATSNEIAVQSNDKKGLSGGGTGGGKFID
jgi:hypothetical protein